MSPLSPLGWGKYLDLRHKLLSLLPFEDVYFTSYLKLSVQWNSHKYEHVKRERIRSLNYINFKCGYTLKGLFFS